MCVCDNSGVLIEYTAVSKVATFKKGLHSANEYEWVLFSFFPHFFLMFLYRKKRECKKILNHKYY